MEQFDDLFNVSRLISGYLKDDLNEDEKQELEDWLNAKPGNREQFRRFTAENKLKSDFSTYGQTDKSSAWKRIIKETGYRKPKSFLSIYRVAAAASIILGLSVGGYFLLHKQPVQQIAQNQFHDIAPGSNKAILTLANGKQISLTDAKNGNIAQQGATNIKKTANGQVVYNANEKFSLEKTAKVTYNTITTPRGGQYHLTLADGTNVWLNAASSITFPIAFTGKDRSVKITGEAYFEVVHEAVMPFNVTVNGQIVEDIGTHFNINAYNDEPAIKTTLLEGAVKVSKGNASAMLKPGQQSVIINKGNNSFVNVSNNVNTDQVLAWKNGKFSFYNSDIQTVMRQLGRWYDVDVEYEGKVPATIFSGEIYRNVNLSKALEILKFTKVNFRVEGKKIIVTS